MSDGVKCIRCGSPHHVQVETVEFIDRVNRNWHTCGLCTCRWRLELGDEGEGEYTLDVRWKRGNQPELAEERVSAEIARLLGA